MVEKPTAEVDSDAQRLDTVMTIVDESIDDIQAIPAREEIQKQKDRLDMIDARIALLDAECRKASVDLRTAGETLKEAIKNKTISVKEALLKKDDAIARYESLSGQLQCIPDLVAEGLDEIQDNTTLQSIAEVQYVLGELGQKSIGSKDIAIIILERRSARTLMLNAIRHWELESDELDNLKQERMRLISTAESLHTKLQEEKKLRAQYTTNRLEPAGHLITETTRRDKLADAVKGIGRSAVGLVRRKTQVPVVRTQLVVGVEQNG
jgi:hypothetical protein